MRNAVYFAPLIAVALLCGCGRARVQTDIHADGSWARTVTFTGQEKKEGQMTPAIDDIFAIPSGAPWKSTKGKKGEDIVITVERVAAAGETIKADVALKGEAPDKLTFANEATVTRAGPRRIEYKETLRWVGERPKDFAHVKPEDLAEIKAALPPPLNTDANAAALANRATIEMIPMMFGPGDPLLALGIMHPDLAERRVTQKIGTLLMKAMEEQFGDKLKPAQRQAIVRKMIEKGFASTQPSKPDPSAGPPSGKGGGGSLTPLMFIVKLPGKIVSHNGTLDDFTGEIYWALFPEATVLKEVTLTAVCELDGK